MQGLVLYVRYAVTPNVKGQSNRPDQSLELYAAAIVPGEFRVKRQNRAKRFHQTDAGSDIWHKVTQRQIDDQVAAVKEALGVLCIRNQIRAEQPGTEGEVLLDT